VVAEVGDDLAQVWRSLRRVGRGVGVDAGNWGVADMGGKEKAALGRLGSLAGSDPAGLKPRAQASG
jgi:hypothetical protein